MSSQLDLAHRQPLLPLGSDFRVQFYDAARLDRYKDAVLTVLERTGVRFGSPKALDVLQEHGARVDRESGVVRFPPDLVVRALASAPRASGWALATAPSTWTWPAARPTTPPTAAAPRSSTGTPASGGRPPRPTWPR